MPTAAREGAGSTACMTRIVERTCSMLGDDNVIETGSRRNQRARATARFSSALPIFERPGMSRSRACFSSSLRVGSSPRRTAAASLPRAVRVCLGRFLRVCFCSRAGLRLFHVRACSARLLGRCHSRSAPRGLLGALACSYCLLNAVVPRHIDLPSSSHTSRERRDTSADTRRRPVLTTVPATRLTRRPPASSP